MWKQLLLAIFTTTITLCVGSSELQLNPQATLVSQVRSVEHDQTSHHVVIHLAEKRICVNPTFMVRLSGQALYLLDLVPNNQTVSDTVTFRYPPMHEAGSYFLEVLTMYCETLNPNAFSNMCLVHPGEGKNMLTLPYSFEVNTAELITKHHRPRWVLRQNATSLFLPTRSQHLCNTPAECVDELKQHNSYEWTDKPPYEHLIKKTLQWSLSNLTSRTGNESITVCMVGASHAAGIVYYANLLPLKHIHPILVEVRFPQLFDVKLLENCSYAVIGFGQWLLQRNPADPADRYEAVIRDMLRAVKASNTPTQVFTRSMNFNGLGEKYISCPALDLRHPPLVDMYNSIMAKVSAEFDIPYIDMRHLQGPLWDIAFDFSHCMDPVWTTEAEYIIHAALSYSHKHHRAPILDPNALLRVPRIVHTLVRFSDSDTVYLYVDGVFREIPLEDTFRSLQYKFEDIHYFDVSVKASVVIGPVLPNI